MQIDLVRAVPADRQRLENLLELYIHDFSEILGNAPEEDGRFGYPSLAAYWREAGRFPFLIRADSQLAGFALVSQGSHISPDPAIVDLTEFFVVRGLRRRGVGVSAALQVFAAFRTTWEVRVMERNAGAQAFWERAVASFTNGSFASFTWQSERGTSSRVFRFVSRSAVNQDLSAGGMRSGE